MPSNTPTTHESYADKLRSLSFGGTREHTTRTQTDVHDNHAVDVTEHFKTDRVDVCVKPKTLNLSLTTKES